MKWLYLPFKIVGDNWFFVTYAFNRLGISATIGMSKQKHLKVLLKNENDELEVVQGKSKMIHIYANPMVVQRLGQRLAWKEKENKMPYIPMLKSKGQGEHVGRVEDRCIPELNTKELMDLDGIG